MIFHFSVLMLSPPHTELTNRIFIFYLHKSFMPFPLRTILIPKPRKLPFPGAQDHPQPPGCPSQVSQQGFQRGWENTVTAMHHSHLSSAPWYLPEMLAGTRAPASLRAAGCTLHSHLSHPSKESRNFFYNPATGSSSSLSHFSYLSCNSTNKPFKSSKCLHGVSQPPPGAELETIHTALPVPGEMSKKLRAIFLLRV